MKFVEAPAADQFCLAYLDLRASSLGRKDFLFTSIAKLIHATS